MVLQFLNTFKHHIFFLSILAIHVLYFASFYGIALVNRDYIRWFNVFVQLFIVAFLLLRFGWYKTSVNSKFDRNVIVTCAGFMLVNLLTTEIFASFFHGKNVASIDVVLIELVRNWSK